MVKPITTGEVKLPAASLNSRLNLLPAAYVPALLKFILMLSPAQAGSSVMALTIIAGADKIMGTLKVSEFTILHLPSASCALKCSTWSPTVSPKMFTGITKLLKLSAACTATGMARLMPGSVST